MAAENIDLIGSRIKELRKQRQMTLKTLSEYTGLSIGFLSSVERNVASPTLQNLKQITTALDTSITDLLAVEHPSHTLLRKKDLNVVEFPEYNQTISYIDFKITPPIYEIIEIHPGKAANPEFRHMNDECCTVLSGQLCIEMNGEKLVLNKGDSVYIKRNTKHRIYNEQKTTCISYWVYLKEK